MLMSSFWQALRIPDAHLFAVEDFPATILFDDHDGNLFNVFVGGEAPGAVDALPAAPDHAAILADP
jgi:hypothetical protein